MHELSTLGPRTLAGNRMHTSPLEWTVAGSGMDPATPKEELREIPKGELRAIPKGGPHR